MPGPVQTTLDQRYSGSTAVAATWEDTVRVLETAELAWITTVRADGRPHVTPLVPVWMDDAVHFHTGAEEQKAVNLRANPHVVVTTGCNTWDHGLDVVVEGTAAQVTDRATLERLAELWAVKWDGRWKLAAGDGVFHDQDGSNEWSSQVFAVKPAKIFAHVKGDPFGHTTHKF